MMDPYNIAICFGPTLVPIPTDRDQVGETYFNLKSKIPAIILCFFQVQYQNLVNELIKNFIIFHEVSYSLLFKADIQDSHPLAASLIIINPHIGTF